MEIRSIIDEIFEGYFKTMTFKPKDPYTSKSYALEREFENWLRRTLASSLEDIIILPKTYETFSGVPDIIIFTPKGTLGVELKIKQNKLSEAQAIWRDRFVKSGDNRKFLLIYPENCREDLIKPLMGGEL